jgi:hypothetical protein
LAEPRHIFGCKALSRSPGLIAPHRRVERIAAARIDRVIDTPDPFSMIGLNHSPGEVNVM